MPKEIVSYSIAQNQLSLKEKVGQLFMLAAFINDTEEEVQEMERLIHDYRIGALCFFHSRASAATNFEGKKAVVHNENSYDRLKELITRYQNAAKHPLLIAMDAEWGLAMRIENTPQYPYAITLGAIQNNNKLIFEVGQQIGLDCREVGIHWNLAPVVDINSNPENPVIGYRSFGDDKEQVCTKAEAYVKGLENTGTLNSIKHFPGHGDTATDSHLGLPIIDKSLEELKDNELYPFQKLIEKGVDSVMVGHLSLPQLDAKEPSTTSSKIITGLFRNEMGFEGIIVSDALNMHAVSKKHSVEGELEATAFAAGMDVLCFSENPVEGIKNILNDATELRIEESFKRIWQLKEKAFLKQGENVAEVKSPIELNKTIAKNVLTELYGNPKKAVEIKNSPFLNLSFAPNKINIFSNKLEEDFQQKAWELSSELPEIKVELEKYQNVVLSIFPPAVKPKNQFGFDSELLDFIRTAIGKKTVLVYLFGNPYVLDILELQSNSNVVLVYQDFDEFQEEAVRHFNGEIPALGKLPIQLKTLQA
ncbi:glycoside hydrolase family 3 protein [Muricauda sp. CAU 1633]|uniref:glycoside hydrolase family 3 protein n=1 Tax=Allomuricauda sp. CAU 1633 TaxID=2816036 RepID=UPI001A8EBCF3|nr:glycoside hydrolase family 3 protein [Muricauda sp. CAU 1633]MBO0322135.1 glycoside hydrolase family 3 protein [Muricauda sp. CAU 1633]